MRLFATALLASSMIAAPAFGQTVVGAATISSPSGSYPAPYDLSNIINQSGLSASYQSGVTSYASFIAGTTHSNKPAFAGFTSTSGLPQTFTFGFSSLISVDAIAFFAVNDTGSVTSFDLYADDDSNFSNGTSALLGSFKPLSGVFSAQSFTFNAVTTRFIQLRALNTAGGTNLTPGIGEMAFRSASVAAAVPEPATWAMMMVGFGLVAGTARYRRKSVKASFA